MKIQHLFVMVLISILSVQCTYQTHCSTKVSFIKSYDKFIQDVKINHNKLVESDWINIDEEFEMYVDKCYPKFKNDLTLSEKVDFWKNTMSYGYYKGTKDGDFDLNFKDMDINISNELDDISIEGKEELEKFIKEEFGKILKRPLMILWMALKKSAMRSNLG